ncbi:uncharacterized protein BKA78DRAFT_128311 [Phyllosticta capitalensis]|uniref:uncharacterized protein n=1 Tax=Phyllosticta capitalensis TaxID=121624 RepID=UPI00312E6857
MLTLALDMWPAFMTSAPMSMRVVNPPYDNTTTHWISGTEDSPLMLKIHDNRSDPDDSTTWRQYRLIRDTCGAPLVAIRFNTEGKRHKPIFHVTRPDSKVPIFTFRPRIDSLCLFKGCCLCSFWLTFSPRKMEGLPSRHPHQQRHCLYERPRRQRRVHRCRGSSYSGWAPHTRADPPPSSEIAIHLPS